MKWTRDHPYNKYELTIQRRHKALDRMKRYAPTAELKAMWAYKHAQFTGLYIHG
jgi:hypothetical protein